MSFPAEEPLDIRKLMSNVMESLGWRQDGAAIAEAAEMFTRRVPRQQTPAVWRDLVALLARDVIRDHQTGAFRERIATVRPSTQEPPAASEPVKRPQAAGGDDSALWYRSESPGFTPPEESAPHAPKIAAAPAPDAGASTPAVPPMPVREQQAVARVASPPPSPEPPAAPLVPKFASAKIQAFHDQWPELDRYVEVAPGQRKLMAECGAADYRYEISLYMDKKNRATKALAEAGSAIKHRQDIRDACLEHGVLTKDLPADVKDRLFKRRVA